MPRQAGGEQRFARAGRPAHQQIVPARRGDLERALGDLLALDLGEVRARPGRLGLGPGGGGSSARALQMREQGQQVGRSDDFERRPPSRLAALDRGADQPLVGGRGMERREQNARATARSGRRGYSSPTAT